MRQVLCAVFAVAVCSGQMCAPLPDPDGPGTVKTATLTHSGFDFSKNVGGSFETGDVPDSDGAVIGWSPAPTVWTNGDGNSVWWRSNSNTEEINYTKDMGEVSLSSVTTVPSTWDGSTTTSLPPFQVNHVYVVKCLDGYAKFRVTAIDAENWTMDVEYVYTSGTGF